jgi:hypothetical protein
MTLLRYTETELLRDHEYATPQVVAGHRLHGGFDGTGRYLSPRTLVREPAVAAWTEALLGRGGAPMRADASLLAGVRMPNTAQHRLLLQSGLEQTFWNNLTIIGLIEGRGRVLAEIPLPDFQEAIIEDIGETAVGHIARGMLRAHGLDEGGEPARGVGGHDVMWFALRDLAFGATDWPVPEVPAAITRPEAANPMPEIARPQAQMLSFLMNLLLIEFRAEIGFESTETLLRDPGLFRERRREAEEAAVVVERIRQDEKLHVDSLRLYLGELRALTFRTVDGGTIRGDRLIDPFWDGLVRWATVEQPRLNAERTRELLARRILAHPDGERILREFDALGMPH